MYGVDFMRIYSSDVCLEAEAPPRGRKLAASASPRCFSASPHDYCLGLVSHIYELN